MSSAWKNRRGVLGHPRIFLFAHGALGQRTTYHSASQRAPWYNADTEVLNPSLERTAEPNGVDTNLESGEHLALLFAVNQRMVVLHRDEGCQIMRYRIVCNGHMMR
jgi:hypothetical protein